MSNPETPATDLQLDSEKPDTGDVLGSLTGYDEIAIRKAFGATVSDLRGDPTMFLRALVFILEKRQGKKDGEAKNAALSMTMEDVNDSFSDEDDDGLEQDADAPLGHLPESDPKGN